MMNEEQMLYCLIAFILGWLVSRHMGNGFSDDDDKACVSKCKERYTDLLKNCQQTDTCHDVFHGCCGCYDF